MTTDAAIVPPPLVQPSRWNEFIEWARDGGYDESWFNRWDSKFHELQRVFLDETSEI
jgi:hypothetical protein